MQLITLALFKKIAPYFALAGFCFVVGLYIGYHVGSSGLTAAKLALSVQQGNDAKAVAESNAAAAFEIEQANVSANTAEAALAEAEKTANSKDADLSDQIASQAAKPGEDAPDAPVLKNTLDILESGQ